MFKKSSKFHYLVNIVLTFFLLLTIAENYLLLQNYPLIIPNNTKIKDNALYSELLGWDNIPNMKFTSNGEEPIPGQENVDHLGRRYQGKDVTNPSKRFLFLGCSFTFGREIADEETFIYKTSRRFPKYQFDNYGVPAYGTHQCRLKMEQLLSKPDCPKYDAIIYSFINNHPYRNVYNFSSFVTSKGTLLGTNPYADFSWNGKLFFHPINRLFFPYTNMFRVSAFLNNTYSEIKSRYSQDYSYKSRIFNAVLDEMLDIAKNHGIDLIVFILEYTEFSISPELIDKGLKVYNARIDNLGFEPKYHVDNDLRLHPNGLANDYWANRLTVLINNNYK